MYSGESKVESELYKEGFPKNITELPNSNSLLRVTIPYHPSKDIVIDEDGDLLVSRNSYLNIALEYSVSSTIPLVGLQLWRGALVLADYIISNGPALFAQKRVLELGAGIGLTSIVAGLFAREVVSTDIPCGDILELIRRNIERNSGIIRAEMSVEPLDFKETEWSKGLTKKIEDSDIVLVADVIYDNDLTEAFVDTLTKILNCTKEKTVLIALEKRYVFTVADLDTVAPCYDYFLEVLKMRWNPPHQSKWEMSEIKIDFQQFFDYERTPHMVLWRISNCRTQKIL